MAEVLITLGIIGIIASMTMPQLLGHYQKKVTETRLKRVYNIIAQTIERSKVEYGDPSGWWLDAIAGKGQSYRDDATELFVSQFWDPWVPKIKDKTYESMKDFGYDKVNGLKMDNTKAMIYVLNDGTVVGIWIMVYIDENGKGGNLSAIGYMVDVNGLEYPNMFGRDIFLFQLNPKTGGIIENTENLTREELIEKCAYSRKTDKFFNNYYCTILIAHDGWEIKPDYPW